MAHIANNTNTKAQVPPPGTGTFSDVTRNRFQRNNYNKFQDSTEINYQFPSAMHSELEDFLKGLKKDPFSEIFVFNPKESDTPTTLADVIKVLSDSKLVDLTKLAGSSSSAAGVSDILKLI